MIDTLFVDVDGVLQFSRPQFTVEMERDYQWADGYLAFQRELLHDPGEARALLGLGDLVDVVRRLLPRHVAGLSAEAFLDRWVADNIVVNEALLGLLPGLSVAQVFLATNQEARRGARIRQLYEGRPGVSGLLISHELGVGKPDRAFFEKALEHADRRAHECLFIDDKPEYVDGAEHVGIATIHYRDNAQLEVELEQRGLWSPPSG